MHIKKTITTIPAWLAALALSPMTAAGMISVNGTELHTTNDIPDYTLLKTLPVHLPVQGGDAAITDLAVPYQLLDSTRGIYRSPIPGIGFSLCQHEAENCLVPSAHALKAAAGYTLRLYKTGALKGGDYTPGTLLAFTLDGENQKVSLGTVTVHNMACSVTRDTVQVTFPSVMASETKETLAEAAFRLPVRCYAPQDYRNVRLTFKYAGHRYSDSTIATNLAGLGIRLKNATGNTVNFAHSTPTAYQSMQFTAALVHLPGQEIQAGALDVSATVTITMR